MNSVATVESPLLEVITVRHDDDPFHKWNDKTTKQQKPPVSEELSTSISTSSTKSSSDSSSSDEEMEIIANFIENVDMDVDVDRDSTYGGHNRSKSLPWTSTRSSSSLSDSSGRHGQLDCDEASSRSSEYASPLQIVQKKGDFHARLRETREIVEHQGVRKGRHSREKSIIQDMIDMSLGKKKVQSSEKMLRIAFAEFYRGLGLLKSYR